MTASGRGCEVTKDAADQLRPLSPDRVTRSWLAKLPSAFTLTRENTVKRSPFGNGRISLDTSMALSGARSTTTGSDQVEAASVVRANRRTLWEGRTTGMSRLAHTM